METGRNFVRVNLTEDDVPGAKLTYSLIEQHSNIQLRRWLMCRELKTSGNKDALVKRVEECIDAGKSDQLAISIDNGKWYEKKLQENKCSEDIKQQPNVSLPPVTGWNTFPSVSLPKFFNEGHIHHHIVESVQFIDKCDNENEDDDINDIHTEKPLRKGREFFKSGHVMNMKDTVRGSTYSLKATVMASYTMSQDYHVLVQISQHSGFILDASCTCKSGQMGRCAHITGLLFALQDYIVQYGTEPVSSTSKTCQWNTGRKRKRDPKSVSDTAYKSLKKKRVDSIISHDIVPSFKTRTESEALNSFLDIIDTGPTGTMWESLLYRRYDTYDIDGERQNILKMNVEMMRSSLLQNERELVKEQRTDEWSAERCIRVTASESKLMSAVRTPESAYSILKNKLWSKSSSTCAMKYGIRSEEKAFKDYQSSMTVDGFVVKPTGFWVSSDSPEIGASPDGVVFDGNDVSPEGLLEIKCPFILKNKLIQNFDVILTKSQLRRFCLERRDGRPILKKSHAYYSQIQTQLGVTGRAWCDLMIWGGEGNFLIVRVRFCESYWNELRDQLVTFHKQWLAPEYFEMRIPRRLLPVCLN